MSNSNVEATLVWPVESYGREYYNIGLTPPNYLHYDYQCNGYILIATEKDTEVTHYNTGSGTFNTTLQAGEVYHYYVNNQDSRGTRIVSNNPIAFSQNSTRGEVYIDGASQTYSISGGATQRYKDIIIDASNNSASRACYITSDKPVSVCLHHFSRVYGELSQPGEAWLPPVEQKVYHICSKPS